VKALVTGGSGFVGSHVVDKLLDAGIETRIFDLQASAYHPNGDVETVVGDITDAEALDRAVADCDVIFHLAAEADVGEVEANPDRAEHVNTRGTLQVLEAARRAGVSRVVYASTVWVYSDCPEREVDEETLIAAPAHIYTATKLAGELYCQSYAELYGIEWTILRFGIPYGPRARGAAVVPAFVEKALGGEPLTIAGSGRQSRRFVYVEDLAEGVVRGMAPEAANRIYNLGGSETTTILEVAQAVAHELGGTEIVHTEARSGDFDGKEISSERAARELGWRAGTPFAEGVRRYVEWRRNGATVAQPPAEARVEPVEEEPPATEHGGVLILSADIGEGHDLPARALAASLMAERPGMPVAVVDSLAAMGRLVQLAVRENSWFVFRWMPWLFDLQYMLLRFAPTRWLGRRVLYMLGARSLLKLIKAHRPREVVATYPGASEIVGELRLRGKLKIPAYSAITDLAGLRFWAHPGIDEHFVIHRESIEEVERIAGPGSARWAQPPTSPEFLEPRSQRDAREALGLPEEGKVIVVSGGGWGIGDLRSAVSTALETEDATVLCLTGRNEGARNRLESEFGDNERVRVLGFTNRMSDLLAAADALIHSTAGLTVLEAQIRGCPVISYGFGVAHIRLNNAAYERFGLAQVARSRSQLGPALRKALKHRPDPDLSFADLPSPASLVLDGKSRTRPRPVWRLRFARVFATALGTLLFIGGGLATDIPDVPHTPFAHTVNRKAAAPTHLANERNAGDARCRRVAPPPANRRCRASQPASP
jgi:UDP-glucose 4-epimerase